MLKEKRRAFVTEYLKDWNATQAAIRAGYSPKTAYSQGQRLLKNVEVRAEIKKLTADMAACNEVEICEIISGLRSIAFAAEDARVNNSDRLRALELLGKYKAMFTDKAEHTVKAQAPAISEAEYIKNLEAELQRRRQAQTIEPAIVRPSITEQADAEVME